MTKKKRLYLSVLIPAGIFLAMVLAGAVYLCLIGPYVDSWGTWLDGPPKEAGTYSLAYVFLKAYFSFENIASLAAFAAGLGFAIWKLFSEKRKRDASPGLLVFFSGCGILASFLPLLFGLLIPVSDTMAFASLGLAEVLEAVISPLSKLLLLCALILAVRMLLAAWGERPAAPSPNK